MKRVAGTVLATLSLALLGTLAGTPSAWADFRVCNATQNLVGVAIGLRGSSGWVTEGWWHIEPANCKTLLEGPLTSRFYYLYAEDAQRGGRWDGPINMCVADKEFKIVGINDCYARGYQRVGFQEHDTGEQVNWMLQLTDEPPPEESAALPSDMPSPPDTPLIGDDNGPIENDDAPGDDSADVSTSPATSTTPPSAEDDAAQPPVKAGDAAGQ